MTTYRSPPLHCLPKKRKPLSWRRRIVLGRKARIWYDAMTDPNPWKSIERELYWIGFNLRRISMDTRKELVELVRAIEEAGSER